MAALGAFPLAEGQPAEGKSAPDSKSPTEAKTISQIRSLSLEEARKSRPAQIEGVVTYFDRSSALCFIEDESGAIRLGPTYPDTEIRPGDLVQVKGVTTLIDNRPALTPAEFLNRGPRGLPKGQLVRVADLGPSDWDGRVVSVNGIVRYAGEERGRLVYEVVADNTRFRVILYSLALSRDFSRIGSRINAEGVFMKVPGEPGKPPRVDILIPFSAGIRFDEAGRASATSLPMTTVGQLAKIQTGERVRLRLSVKEFAPRVSLSGGDSTGEIRAQTRLAAPVTPGTVVDLAGFLARTNAALFLEDATYQRVGFVVPAEAEQLRKSSQLPRIQSVAAVRRLSNDEASKNYPVDLRGVITYFDPETNMLFFQGATEGIYVYAADQRLDLRNGNLVMLRGNTDRGRFAPIIANPVFEIEGDAPMPEPRDVTFAELTTGTKDSQWIRTKGVVRSMTRRNNTLEFEVAPPSGDGSFQLEVMHSSKQSVDLEYLDAEIEVEAVCATKIGSMEQFLGIQLYSPGLSHLQLVRQSPSDPYLTPPSSVISLLQFNPERGLNRRVHLRGTVTWTNGRRLFVQDDSGGVQVHSAERMPWRVGQGVEVVGFPKLNDGAPVVLDAATRASDTPRVRLRPVASSPRQVVDRAEGFDGRLVTLSGMLLEKGRFDEQVTFLMQDRSVMFHAFLPATLAKEVEKVRPGSRLSLTGVCSLQGNELGQPRSTYLYLRSLTDIVILSAGPFWDLQSLILALGTSSFLVLGGFVWVSALRSQVKKQTSLIRKNLETEKALERRFTEFTRHFPGIAYIKDLKGRYVFANKTYLDLLGLDDARIEGKTDHDIGPAEWAEERTRQDEQLLKAATRHEVEETVPHGSRRTWLTTRFCIFGANGEPHLICGLALETTEAKSLQNQLIESQKMESIGRLAGGIAHDFNNMLTVIRGHADLIQQESLPPAAWESARQICASSNKAASLVRQLLTFSRSQASKSLTIDLNDSARGMSKMLERILGEDIALETRLHESELPLESDPALLDQILLNFAVNSRDAMPNGGLFTVETFPRRVAQEHLQKWPQSRVGDFVCLRVSDTGKGIPEENLDKIFEPFFTTKEVGQGTGLGLATVFGIVKQHRGWIRVSSEVGRGTSFEVCFPTSTNPRVDVPPPPMADRTAEGGQETILLVEDEADLRRLTTTVLKNNGYTVLAAENGRAAFDLLTQNTQAPALIITDVVMPGSVSGIQLAKLASGMRPDLPVILTSGYSREVKGAIETGGNLWAFLPKPYTSDELLYAIRDALAKAVGAARK